MKALLAVIGLASGILTVLGAITTKLLGALLSTNREQNVRIESLAERIEEFGERLASNSTAVILVDKRLDGFKASLDEAWLRIRGLESDVRERP